MNKLEIGYYKCVRISDCYFRVEKEKLVDIRGIWDANTKIIFSHYLFCAGKPFDLILYFITVVSFQKPQCQDSAICKSSGFLNVPFYNKQAN